MRILASMVVICNDRGDVSHGDGIAPSGVVNGDGRAPTPVIIIVAMCDTEQRIIVDAVLVEMALVPRGYCCCSARCS